MEILACQHSWGGTGCPGPVTSARRRDLRPGPGPLRAVTWSLLSAAPAPPRSRSRGTHPRCRPLAPVAGSPSARRGRGSRAAARPPPPVPHRSPPPLPASFSASAGRPGPAARSPGAAVARARAVFQGKGSGLLPAQGEPAAGTAWPSPARAGGDSGWPHPSEAVVGAGPGGENCSLPRVRVAGVPLAATLLPTGWGSQPLPLPSPGRPDGLRPGARLQAGVGRALGGARALCPEL